MLELRDLEGGKGERDPLAGAAGDRVFLDVTIRGERNFLEDLALGWSLFPIPWLTAVLALSDFQAFWIFVFLVTSTSAAGNELWLKPWLRQPRPQRSDSFGMPSGHSLCAGLLLCLLLQGWGAGRIRVPGWLLGLLYLPVPWARWVNGDHTWQQCLAGWLLGLGLGVLTYPVSRLI